ERAGHDINYVALAGLLAIDTSGAQSMPHVPRMFLADIGGGALSATAGVLAWLTFPGARALLQGGDVTPADLPIFDLEACYNIYRTSDGQYVALGALEHKFFRAFCER